MAKKPYSNFLYYIQNEFRSLEELPFNEVDSAIFSWLSYLFYIQDFKGACTREGLSLIELLRGEYYAALFRSVYWEEETRALFFAVLSSPRFQKTRISLHCDINNLETSLQFSATVFSFSETLHYIVFRGTDKTIHGWKEDVMLLLQNGAPGQKAAVNYLNKVGKTLQGELIAGGHSKGGHLAVYAAAHCEEVIQKRISAIYSHDGPGFLRKDVDHPGMQAILDRIHKTVPQSAMVGLILVNRIKPDYIKSNHIGPLQHYLGSWEVDGHAFARIPSEDISGSFLVNNLNEWAETASQQELEDFMSGLFEIIEVTGIDDLDELRKRPLHYMLMIAKRYYRIDKEKRLLIKNTFRRILYGKNIQRMLAFISDEDDEEKANVKISKAKKALSTSLLIFIMILGFLASQMIGNIFLGGTWIARMTIWVIIFFMIWITYLLIKRKRRKKRKSKETD